MRVASDDPGFRYRYQKEGRSGGHSVCEYFSRLNPPARPSGSGDGTPRHSATE